MSGIFQSGQMGQTVNLLVFTFGGSNPSVPTFLSSIFKKYLCARDFRLNKFAEVAQLIEH